MGVALWTYTHVFQHKTFQKTYKCKVGIPIIYYFLLNFRTATLPTAPQQKRHTSNAKKKRKRQRAKQGKGENVTLIKADENVLAVLALVFLTC